VSAARFELVADAVPAPGPAHLEDGLRSALAATEKLHAEGFTVIAVRIDDRKPVLWIQNPAGRLQGVMVSRERKDHGPERVMVARYDGVQVRWTVWGN
jgi:hypothetical protein